MRHSLLLFLIISVSSLLGQTKFGGLWTDGGQSFRPYEPENGLIQFEGGTLHEGGSMFYGELLSDTTIKILGRRPDSQSSPSYGEVGDILKYRKIQDYELLTLTNPTGTLKGILQKHKGGFREIVINNKINHQLSGKYRKIGSGSTISFAINEPSVNGLTAGTSYKFEEEYDFPLDVVTVGSTSFFYEKGKRTLTLFEAVMDKHQEFEKGEFIMKLTLLENFPIVDTGLEGDYTFASTIPLIDDILFHYTNEELRLIRNEIFARYGHKFKSADLRIHFESKTWYEPISEDVTSKLNELEKLNVQQIRNIEARKIQLKMSNNR
ncbi:MAG: YARHG domain-containing protein [Cyclobacteriaceae bacterium]